MGRRNPLIYSAIYFLIPFPTLCSLCTDATSPKESPKFYEGRGGGGGGRAYTQTNPLQRTKSSNVGSLKIENTQWRPALEALLIIWRDKNAHCLRWFLWEALSYIESLKRVYFLILSYGKIWKVRTFFFRVSPKYRENQEKTLSSSKYKYSFYNEEIRKHSCQCVFGICCFLRICLLRRFVVSRTGVSFCVFLACSKLSDSGEDAKVKDALSQFIGPDYLRRSLEQARVIHEVQPKKWLFSRLHDF